MTVKIAFVCQWFPPEPVQVPEGIALALRAEGAHVEVLTGIPNYPSGSVAPGYKARQRRYENRDGLLVYRAPLYPSHDSSAIKRFLNYASWALSSSIFGQRVLRRSDVSLVYSSPATAVLPAIVARKLWRTPYVLLIQDVWPDSIFASGFLRGRLGRCARRLVHAFVDYSYRQAERIVVISPGMVDLLADRGVPRHKLQLVYNWLPASETDFPTRTESSLRDKVDVPSDARLFLYAGNHGHAQRLDVLIRAFADRIVDSRAHLVLLGDGVAKEALQAEAAGNKRIHFLDPVPRGEAAQLTSTADFHVVCLADDPLFAVTMPSKVQSGLAAGKPMLVVAEGDPAEVVRGAGAGVAASPRFTPEVAQAINCLVRLDEAELVRMGHRGRSYYRSTMDVSVGAPAMYDVLRRTAGRRRSVDRPTILKKR